MSPTKKEVTPEGIQAAARIATARANKNAGGERQGATIAPVLASNTTPVITPDSLQPTPTPVVSETPVPTAQTKLQADLEATQEDALLKKTEAAKLAAETATKGSYKSLLDQMAQAKGLTTLTAEAYAKEGGVDSITPELNDINDQIRREQLSLRRATEAIQKQGGGLQSGALAEISNLERDSLAKQADLSVIQMAVQGRYDSAKEIADRAVAAQFEEQTQKLDIAKFDYIENKDLFTTAEQREYDLLFQDRQNKIEDAKENKKSIYDLGIQASLDGAPTAVVSRMMAAKTREEALALGGQYIGALDRQAKQASISSSYASRRNSVIDAAKNGDPKAIQELGFDPNKSTPLGEYSSIIDTASLLVGAERGQETRRAMASAVERGDYTTAYSQIANNVQSNLQGEAASRFGAARTDIQVLSGLRDTIEQFEAQGGDTGFLKGNADVIARKFGQLATDPKFASLAVQLEREFQAYRQQMTGAAFGAGESADYEKVNPSSTKSLELNLATIDGAIRQLENRVVGTVESYVPSSREIYDLATGNEKVINSSDPAKEPIGSVIEIGGVRYRKTGDDAYDPI